MTVTLGSQIAATDYNSLQSSVSNILGNTSSDPTYGYGQGVTSAPVSSGNLITHTEWANLKTDILKIAGHQGTSTDPTVIGLPSITLNKEIDTADVNVFANVIPVITSNRYVSAQSSQETLTPDISSTRTASWGNPAVPVVTHAFTLTFPDSNSARYFFNAGGTINFKASRTGGSTSPQNTDWSDILSAFSGSNSVIFNYNSCTAVSGQNSSIGWYQLTSTPQTVYKKSGNGGESGGGVYASNDYHINMSCDVTNNGTGTGKILYVTVYFSDTHTGGSDIVDGTLSSNIFITRPSGANVSVVGPTGVNTVTLDTGTVPSKVATSLTLAASPSSLSPGASTTLTATVNPSYATGTITFKDNGSTIGSPATITGGVATYTYNSVPAGSHSIIAVYSGDGTYNISSSLPTVVSVAQLSSSVSLASSSSTPSYGTSITLTATMTPSAATGTVSFYDGSTDIGDQTLLTGVARLTTSALTGGPHPNITAVYQGDTTYKTSTSSPVTVTVSKSSITALLAASSSSFTQGTNITLTLTLGETDATGSVTFYDHDDNTNLGTAAVQAGTGIATLSTSNFNGGTKTNITAVYSGDNNYLTQTSNAISLVVAPKTTSVTIATSNASVAYGTAITFTATVSYVGTDHQPTGTVTFKDGATTIATGTVGNGTICTASISTSTLSVGTHNITATYNGDANNAAATSTATNVVISRATTSTTMAASLTTPKQGTPVTFTATITPSVATGSVVFYDGTTSLGSGSVSNGSVSFATSALSVAAHSITAAYSGDVNYNSSTSAISTVTVHTPVPQVPTISFIISPYSYHFGGCYGTGWNDLYCEIDPTNGLYFSINGAAADYTVASPGYTGYWSPNGHTTVANPTTVSGVMKHQMVSAANFFAASHDSGWISFYSAGRDNLAFRAVTTWDGTTYTVKCYGDCKGGGNGGQLVLTQTVSIPTI